MRLQKAKNYWQKQNKKVESGELKVISFSTLHFKLSTFHFMSAFQLDIVTPESAIFSGKVSAVKIPGSNGSFSVLHNHAPLISSLSQGDLEITEEAGNKLTFLTKGGVAEVINNKVTILIESVLKGMENVKKEE